MSVASAKFAFQIDATQSFQHLAMSQDEILASKKGTVTLQDGSTKEMTIFFAANQDAVRELQKSGLARSNHQTMNDFKRFCMASQKNLSSSQFAYSMRNVKNGMNGKYAISKPSFSDQLRTDYDTSMSLPFGTLSAKFRKASDSGLVIRVGNDGVENSYQAPPKKATDFTSDEIMKFRSKNGGIQQAPTNDDEKLQKSTIQRKSSDPSSDRTEKLQSAAPKRHSISREKHITQRRKDIADPFISSESRSTHTAPKEALTELASTARASVTSRIAPSTTTDPGAFNESGILGTTGE